MQRFVRTTVSALMLLLVAAVSVVGPVYASQPTVFGARALGMGGAFTAVVDDASAVHWNPAAIGLRTISINASVNASGIEGLTRLQTLLDADPIEFLTWEGSETAVVGAMAGVHVGAIGIASMANGELSVKGTTTAKSGHVQARADIGVGLARDLVGSSVGGLSLRAGLAVRRATAQRLDFSVAAVPGNEPDVTEKRLSGQGYGLDLGVLMKATNMITLAATVHDVTGQMTWKADGEQPKTESAKTAFRAGIAIQPPLLGTTVAADIASGGEVRYGVEKRLLFNGLALRIGQIHRDDQSWTTAGVGLALGPVKLDAATITPDFSDFGYAIEGAFEF